MSSRASPPVGRVNLFSLMDLSRLLRLETNEAGARAREEERARAGETARELAGVIEWKPHHVDLSTYRGRPKGEL